MPRGCPIFAILTACLASGLPAQTDVDRSILEGLRDSLTRMTDTVALARLEAAAIARAKADRDNAIVHVRLGFIAYRLGELTGGDRHYEDAAGEFEWAAELQPDWPYPWYGVGLAELALGEHRVIAIENLRQQLGRDYLSTAARAFARAAQADPAFGRAAIDLANTALAQRIRPRLEVALEAVRLAARAAGDRPDVQLARGRVEREVGEGDSALVGFRAYLAQGGDSGVGLLELARTLYFARRPAEAARAYFGGAAAADSAAVALYRVDLGWAASPDELAAFDAADGPAARSALLARFWERRDLGEAWDAGQRLAEHYRRWFYARRNFRLVSHHRRYDITEVFHAEQREFDDRGVIYLRHGEPDQRATFARVGLEPNISWLYHRPGGDLVFHFVARDDVQDYRLVESLADVLGFGRAVEAQGRVDPAVSELYASRSEFGRVYRDVAGGVGGPVRWLAEERSAGRRSISLGTGSDSYERRFELPLGVVASDFVTGAEPGGPQAQRLHLVFAIPAGRLTAERDTAGVRYPLRFTLIVADSADRLVARLDTIRVFGTPEPLRGASFLTGRLEVPVPPGRQRYRLLVETPDGVSGALVGGDSVEVEALDGRRFAVSALVVGRAGSGLVWPAPGDTVLLNPLGRFPERGVAELYYEVYGLAPGQPYHTVVRLERRSGGSVFAAVRRLFGGGRGGVLLEFDAVADGLAMRTHRAIDLRDSPRGAYRVTLAITDPVSGRTVTRARPFEVVAAP